MSKTILITGATDGIGLETAKKLLQQGHTILAHGRNGEKLNKLKKELATTGKIETYLADLSSKDAVLYLAKEVAKNHSSINVLINNAAVLKTTDVVTTDGLDVRFVVNTLAPYLLTKKLLPLLKGSGRVINVASAAQASVNFHALSGKAITLTDMEAYSQSKLALIMWSTSMSKIVDPNETIFVSVNPGSLLGTKMVKEAFNIEGKSISIGADILVKLAIHYESTTISGKYFDNDLNQFRIHHPDALDKQRCHDLLNTMNDILQFS